MAKTFLSAKREDRRQNIGKDNCHLNSYRVVHGMARALAASIAYILMV